MPKNVFAKKIAVYLPLISVDIKYTSEQTDPIKTENLPPEIVINEKWTEIIPTKTANHISQLITSSA